MYKNLDTVVLTHDIDEHSLRSGAVGAIVDVYGNGEAYEVEFVDFIDGSTIALLTLRPDELKPFEMPATATWKSTFAAWRGFIQIPILTISRSVSKTESANVSLLL